MDIGAIFLLLSVCLLVGLFVARPFMERRHFLTESAGDQELSSLLAERDRLIGALQELDFDYTLGKIPTQDYPVMRASLLQRASDVLRKLDVLQPQAVVRADAESRVEAVIAARRADAAVENTQTAEVSDDEVEELLAARRTARKEKSAGFCPKCGKPVLRSDRFCPACGKSIS
ncbi:MAG: zinc ribbon domain-containing protein [Chloroflexi bacterium]|nr:zinc ribbon domain-containing protein [Chloroflexota bacterium]